MRQARAGSTARIERCGAGACAPSVNLKQIFDKIRSYRYNEINENQAAEINDAARNEKECR